jgi:transketolase
MGAIVNGLILHGGLRSYAATFLIFSDYMKPSIRLSALMNIPALYIFTHDSIGVGEDGPTHQPIEQVAALRAMPNLNVFRPADGYEVAAGYQLWLTSQKPTALILSRQKLAYIEGNFQGALRGAYILKDSDDFGLIMIASGSEVSLILEAAEILEKENIKVRVVSMPCQNLFAEQDQIYQDHVLPPSCTKRLAVEAATTSCWHKYIGLNGTVIGLDSFGISGKGTELFKYFGFTAEAIASEAKKLLNI